MFTLPQMKKTMAREIPPKRKFRFFRGNIFCKDFSFSTAF